MKYHVYLKGKRVFSSHIEDECKYVLDEFLLYGSKDLYYAEEITGSPYKDCTNISEETPLEMNNKLRDMNF